MGWYSQGTHVIDFEERADGTIQFKRGRLVHPPERQRVGLRDLQGGPQPRRVLHLLGRHRRLQPRHGPQRHRHLQGHAAAASGSGRAADRGHRAGLRAGSLRRAPRALPAPRRSGACGSAPAGPPCAVAPAVRRAGAAGSGATASRASRGRGCWSCSARAAPCGWWRAPPAVTARAGSPPAPGHAGCGARGGSARDCASAGASSTARDAAGSATSPSPTPASPAGRARCAATCASLASGRFRHVGTTERSLNEGDRSRLRTHGHHVDQGRPGADRLRALLPHDRRDPRPEPAAPLEGRGGGQGGRLGARPSRAGSRPSTGRPARSGASITRPGRTSR